jgi:8-oxo-dGTP pyrophosphatase MutT (NUDIX family)
MGYIEDLRKAIGHKLVNIAATAVIVEDGSGKVLLQKRSEPFETWGLPGGIMELGETSEAAGKREVFEETGLLIDDLKLIGVFSGEKSYVKLNNGDEYYAVIIAYYSKNIRGNLKADGVESLECKFFRTDEIPDNMLSRHRFILEDYLRQRQAIV